jgi:hypothetical protein
MVTHRPVRTARQHEDRRAGRQTSALAGSSYADGDRYVIDVGELGTAGTERLRLLYDLTVAGDYRRAWRALLEVLGEA